MVVIKCQIQKCSYQTPDDSRELVCRLLDLNRIKHEKNSGSSKSKSTPNESQLIRQRVGHVISQNTQLAFILRWEAFKNGSIISSQNSRTLLKCAHDKLGDIMLANDSRLMAWSEEYVAKLMDSVAVVKVAVSVKRAELQSLHQVHDEPFRTFATRVRNKVETCNFTTVSECECGNKNVTSYTADAIKDVVLQVQVMKRLEEKF